MKLPAYPFALSAAAWAAGAEAALLLGAPRWLASALLGAVLACLVLFLWLGRPDAER